MTRRVDCSRPWGGYERRAVDEERAREERGSISQIWLQKQYDFTLIRRCATSKRYQTMKRSTVRKKEETSRRGIYSDETVSLAR